MLTLTNTATAARFEALTTYDQFLYIPVEKGNCGCTNYNGMLSNITPCAAERYIKQGGNLLKEKENVEQSNDDNEFDS
jgi:hypothetical protein